MAIDKDELVSKIKELLKPEVTKISYDTWILPLDIRSIENDNIVFTTTSEYQKDFIENKLQNIMFLGVAFLFTAFMLLLVKNKNGKKDDYDITLKDALIIGIFQIIALFPGISRSGTTLVLCLLVGMSRSTALKYTFILYFPISVGTMILGVKDIVEAGNLATVAIPYLLGMIAAGIVTYFSYRWLSEIVKRGNLWKFSIYCVCLAVFIFIYFR